MAIYICTVCGFEYDENSEGGGWESLPEGWVCPVCGAGKSLYEIKTPEAAVGHSTQLLPHGEQEKSEGEYLKTWERTSDDTEG